MLTLKNAEKWVGDINDYLRDPETKKAVRQSAKKMLPKGLKIKVGRELEPFPTIAYRPSTSNGRSAVEEIQNYERMNGTKWRDRVR